MYITETTLKGYVFEYLKEIMDVIEKEKLGNVSYNILDFTEFVICKENDKEMAK